MKEKRHGFKVRMCVASCDGGETLELPNVLSVDSLAVSRNAPVSSKDLQSWPHLRDLRLPPAARGDVLLLIGADVPEAFWTLEECRGKRGEPYALRTILGWSLLDPATAQHTSTNLSTHHVRATDLLLERQVECLWKLDEVPCVTKSYHHYVERRPLRVAFDEHF